MVHVCVMLPPVCVSRPGTNTATFSTLNYVLYALFASILAMFVTGYTSVHVFILLFLALGLFISVHWCVTRGGVCVHYMLLLNTVEK